MLGVRGKGEVLTGLWWGNLRERDHLEDLGVDGKIIFKWILSKTGNVRTRINVTSKERSRDHCCRGKAVSITYYECVCL
jgi:hypothetical protein